MTTYTDIEEPNTDTVVTRHSSDHARSRGEPPGHRVARKNRE